MTQICSILLASAIDKPSEQYTIWHYSRSIVLSVKEYKNNIFVYFINNRHCDQEFRSEIYCFKNFDADFCHYEHKELKYLGTIIRPTEVELHFFTNNTN